MQAECAREALREGLGDTRRAAQTAADPRLWTRRYPLPAVGVALALGFLLAPAGRATPDPSDGRRNGKPRAKARTRRRRQFRAALSGGFLGPLLSRLARRYAAALLQSFAQHSYGPGEPGETPESPSAESATAEQVRY